MTATFYVRPYESGDLSTINNNHVCSLQYDDDNLVITYVKVWLEFYNNPTFSGLKASIYADQGDQVGKLIATSNNTFEPASLTNDYAVLKVPFNFDGVPFKAGNKYHVAISATSYTYSASSFISAVIGYPNPNYTPVDTIDPRNLDNLPTGVVVVGAIYDI